MPKATLAASLEQQGYEKFWLVTMNGKTSKALDSLVDCFDWIIDNADEKIVSTININRKWRKPEVSFKRAAKMKVKREHRIPIKVVMKDGQKSPSS